MVRKTLASEDRVPDASNPDRSPQGGMARSFEDIHLIEKQEMTL